MGIFSSSNFAAGNFAAQLFHRATVSPQVIPTREVSLYDFFARFVFEQNADEAAAVSALLQFVLEFIFCVLDASSICKTLQLRGNSGHLCKSKVVDFGKCIVMIANCDDRNRNPV